MSPAERVRKVLHHIGRQGAFLGFLAILDLTVGYALRQPLPPGLTYHNVYQPFVDLMPLSLWAAWWFATSGVVAVAAVWQGLRPVAFFAAALLKTGWAIGYLIGWGEHLPFFTRGYQTAAIWLAFAAVVLIVSGWQENVPGGSR